MPDSSVKPVPVMEKLLPASGSEEKALTAAEKGPTEYVEASQPSSPCCSTECSSVDILDLLGEKRKCEVATVDPIRQHWFK